MFDWLIRTPQFDPDHPRWTKYFETADTLAALFSGLTGFQIANAPESFFGERGVASAAVGGLPSADRGDSKFAQMATAVWICTNTLPLIREVAQVLDHKNLTGKLNPSELVKNIVEFLKTET